MAATVGVLSLSVGGVVAWARFGETWRAWWVGDALGALVVAPLLTTWIAGGHLRTGARRAAEAGSLAATLALGTLFVFGPPMPGVEPLQQPYLLLPPLIWAALRFGPRGASASTFIVAALAIALTAAGHGPFAGARLRESLVRLQVFMAFDAAT